MLVCTPPQTANGLIPQKPLPEGIELVDGARYGWVPHSFDQMNGRNIGVYEVLAAMEYPDVVLPSRTHEGHLQYIRGDVKVMYDPVSNLICTAAGRNGDDHPRKPLIPAGAPMNLAAIVDPKTLRKLKEAAVDKPEKADTSATNLGVERTGLTDWAMAQIEAMPPGTHFTTQELYAVMPAGLKRHHTSEKNGRGALGGVFGPNTRIGRAGLAVRVPGRTGWMKPHPVISTVPELPPAPPQETRNDQVLEVIKEAHELADAMEFVETLDAAVATTQAEQKPAESEPETPEPPTLELLRGDITGQKRAIYGRMHEVMGMLEDLGWAYEFCQNNKTFKLEGEWPAA